MTHNVTDPENEGTQISDILAPSLSGATIFLTGVPASDSLVWREGELLPTFCPRIQRFLGVSHNIEDTVSSSVHPLAKWRQVPLSSDILPKHFSDEVQPGSDIFLSFKDDTERSIFLEHALNLTENMVGGNAHGTTNIEGSKLVSDLSFSTIVSTEVSFGISSSSESAADNQTISFTGQLQDLKQIPTARHLQHIHPQTITFNVLVGVISTETRTVQSRNRMRELDLVEVLVGDETSAPFKITFWLPANENIEGPSDVQPHNRSSRGVLAALRAGDVVLVTNVALSVFKGVPYGQSLDRKYAQNNTSITILSENVRGLSDQSIAKLDRVRQWTQDFVGRAIRRPASSPIFDGVGKKRRLGSQDLPDDSQLSL